MIIVCGYYVELASPNDKLFWRKPAVLHLFEESVFGSFDMVQTHDLASSCLYSTHRDLSKHRETTPLLAKSSMHVIIGLRLR